VVDTGASAQLWHWVGHDGMGSVKGRAHPQPARGSGGALWAPLAGYGAPADIKFGAFWPKMLHLVVAILDMTWLDRVLFCNFCCSIGFKVGCKMKKIRLVNQQSHVFETFSHCWTTNSLSSAFVEWQWHNITEHRVSRINNSTIPYHMGQAIWLRSAEAAFCAQYAAPR